LVAALRVRTPGTLIVDLIFVGRRSAHWTAPVGAGWPNRMLQVGPIETMVKLAVQPEGAFVRSS
jgi:hypothetical protein